MFQIPSMKIYKILIVDGIVQNVKMIYFSDQLNKLKLLHWPVIVTEALKIVNVEQTKMSFISGLKFSSTNTNSIRGKIVVILPCFSSTSACCYLRKLTTLEQLQNNVGQIDSINKVLFYHV